MIIMSKRFILTLITAVSTLFLVSALQAAPASDQLSTVTTGEQKIFKQDLPGAKKKAVAQALELAVEKAFSTLVSHQVFASNLEFLYDRLLPSTSDYVVTYRVLGEIEHKGKYLVGVESKINLNQVKKTLEDARIIRVGQDKPMVLLLIAEQGPDDLLPKYWWGKNPEPYTSIVQTILRKEMSQNRMPLAVNGPDYPDPEFYAIQFKGIYDKASAMALGKALKADMVVMGKASASESFNRMGDAKTFEALIDLTALDLGTQKEVVQTRATATASGDMESEAAVQSLTAAAQEAAKDLGMKIDAFWSQSLRKENSFDVVIEGDNFLPRFIALKRRLKDIREIENMQPKEMGSDNAILELLYKGSPDQFANAVLLRTFEGFGLEIAEVTQELVRIRFVEEAVQQAPLSQNPEIVPENPLENQAQ
jgi:hypothetical protein